MPATKSASGPWVELKVMRSKDAMTLEQLSKLAGIALGHLSDLENGKRRPTPRIIAKLADIMNVPKSMLEPRVDDGVTARAVAS